MSRISELINCVKIYNLCNHCDNSTYRGCSVDNVNCKEEIEKQIVSEIRADERRKFVEWLTKSDYANGYFDTSNGYISIDKVLAKYEKQMEGRTE